MKSSDSGISLPHDKQKPNHSEATSTSSTSSSQGGHKSSVSLDASEFISFAMFRLWHPKSIERRKTVHAVSAPTPGPGLVENAASNPSGIISPEGTLLWYPQFVHQVHRLLRHACLPTPFIFMALLYIARLRQFLPATGTEAAPTGHEEYRLFLAALMISQKQNSDSRYANRAWAKISNLPLDEVNRVECEFLRGMRWSLHIRDDQYNQWVQAMQTLGKEHALVLRAFAMEEAELKKLEGQLQGRPDLMEEIHSVRRSRTVA
ncbi:hypothetical protein HDU91_003253 [Kappamyces sp. JEL0680]|nr:hypothetical protein HDU91_003253 [Kappamyces sp. JEL0680]